MEDLIDENIEDDDLPLVSSENEVNEIETSLESQPHGGSLKREKKGIDKTGLAYYGDSFTGYQKVPEVKDLIPAFKEYYYQRKIADPKGTGLLKIARDFNEIVQKEGKKFHPYTTQIRFWTKKWDKDILEQMNFKDGAVIAKKNVHQVIKTRNEEKGLVYDVPADDVLEMGVKTLGGELLNDAMQMLRDDQELEDIYDTDELIKKRNYIVNVFAHVTKLVHGKASLMLKASQEKRENASFFMDILNKASSGKMSDEEMALLENSYLKPSLDSQKTNEPTTV